MYRTSTSADEPGTIRRDMAAVDFEILLFPAMCEPYWANDPHGEDVGSSACTAYLVELSYALGLSAWIVAQNRKVELVQPKAKLSLLSRVPH